MKTKSALFISSSPVNKVNAPGCLLSLSLSLSCTFELGLLKQTQQRELKQGQKRKVLSPDLYSLAIKQQFHDLENKICTSQQAVGGKESLILWNWV